MFGREVGSRCCGVPLGRVFMCRAFWEVVFRGVLDGGIVFGALLRKILFVGDVVDVDVGAGDCGDPG
jgi:hypothetical protein